MMNFFKITPLICILAGTLSTSWALDVPKKSHLDGRVYSTAYNAKNVYPIYAVCGMASVITFAPHETIESWASGYSTAWEFDARDNHFFLKPKADDASTNLIVVTNKRSYLFELQLQNNKRKATFSLKFTYPEDEALKAKALAEEKERQSLLNQATLDDKFNDEKETINRDYVMNFGKAEESKRIAPVKAFDDGRFTYIQFKLQSDFPVAYQVRNGQEVITNSHVKGNWLVLHGVFPELRLRAGKAVVGLYNQSFDEESFKSTPTNVTVEGLTREIVTEGVNP